MKLKKKLGMSLGERLGMKLGTRLARRDEAGIEDGRESMGTWLRGRDWGRLEGTG